MKPGPPLKMTVTSLQKMVNRLLGEANKFSQYNFREHMIRRINEDFPIKEGMTDKGREDFIKRSDLLLSQLKRMTTISSLYSGVNGGMEVEEVEVEVKTRKQGGKVNDEKINK